MIKRPPTGTIPEDPGSYQFNADLLMRHEKCDVTADDHQNKSAVNDPNTGIAAYLESRIKARHILNRRNHNLALAHLVEGLVHLVQLDPRRDHLVEEQPSVEVEVDVLGHVEAEAVRAHVGARDLLLLERHEDVIQAEVGFRSRASAAVRQQNDPGQRRQPS